MVVQHKDNMILLILYIHSLGASEQIQAFVPAKIVICKSEFGKESSDA